MAYEKKMRPAPYLQKVREQRYLSQRKLAELAGVSRHTVASIEAKQEARPGTLEKLAAALDVLPKDLTGEHSADQAAHEAWLDHLLSEKKSYVPGDYIYDSDLIASGTPAELARLKLENRELRHRIEVLEEQSEKMRAAVEAASEERRRRETEGRPDAG